MKKASDLQVFERCHLQKLIPFDVIEIHSSVVHGFSIIITTENKRKSIGLHAKSKQNKQQKKKKTCNSFTGSFSSLLQSAYFLS